MTLLQPTPEELRTRHEARLAELAARTQRWHARRRRLMRTFTIVGGLSLVVSARLAALDGGMSWAAYAAFMVAGGGCGWWIAHNSLGILRGMLAYGLGSFAAWLGCLGCGWWHADTNVGSLILMMMGWLAWIVIGGVLGMVSSQFDSDNLQI